MNYQIMMLLGQDGVTNGAIYALLALSILLVFTVTRILLIPQGEFVSFAALCMAAMESGKPLYVGWLLLALSLTALALEIKDRSKAIGSLQVKAADFLIPAYAVIACCITMLTPVSSLGTSMHALLTLALIVPLGPLMYRVFFQAIAAGHSLVLLIVSIAVHAALVGIGLLMFGAEGARIQPFSEGSITLGGTNINSQTIWVVVVSLILIVALYFFFERTLYGKALRATAVNRLGAELVGISPELAGKASFSLAAMIGALSGILIAPITTIYFDSGFIISLKGFVGSIIGGLASYPVAAVGALGIGLTEAFSTFWASSYKEVIVFTLILPFLLWRSIAHGGLEEEE